MAFLRFDFIIISLLMSPLLLGNRRSVWIRHKENVPELTTRAQCELVLTTANAAGTKGLTCHSKYGGLSSLT
jgi:hypothetical protein